MKTGGNILVVDDDGISLRAASRILSSFGYTPVTASSGPEAIEKLSDDIRLVLLDVMMPGMDGFEAARIIRENPLYGDIPIIMVTSLTGKADRLLAIQAGANDFVSKPIDRVELEIRIASHLKLKEAQDKRRESDARFRMLVENSPVGIFYCNREGEIEECNAAARDLLELKPGEHGPLWDGAKYPEHVPRGLPSTLKECLESGNAAVKEFPAGKHGDRHALLHVVPVCDSGERVVGLQVVAADITDRKQLEEVSLRRSRLMAFVEMARGSVKYFSEALKTIDDRVAMGLMALESADYGEVGILLQEIRAAVQNSAKITGLLGKFSRGYSKRGAPDGRTEFDFSDAIRIAVETARVAWSSPSGDEAHAIDLECDLADDCVIEGKKADVVEAASHLIRNATEAMPEGGKLRVRTFREKDCAVLEVQDSGVGMSEDEIKRIGTPFWTSKESHVGLGVAVSLGIIRRHYGSFALASKKGKGTAVLARFPLISKQQETAEDLTVDIRASNPAILFVDPGQAADDAAVGLPSSGTVHIARTIEEAEHVIRDRNIDVIVCQEAFSGRDILEFSKRVSIFFADKGMVRPPFIMLAQDKDSVVCEKGISEAYLDRVLEATIDPADLMWIIHEEVHAAINRPRMAGTLGRIDILDVVQMMLLSGQKLVLEAVSPYEGIRGLLYISNGEILHAKCGDLEGEEALYRALGLKLGSFGTLAWTDPPRRTIEMTGEQLLMEAARRRDEFQGPVEGD
jgi:PAS domain S-box-containing protein